MAAGAMLLSCHKEIDAPTPNKRPVIDVEPAIVDAQFTLTRSSMSGANVDWVPRPASRTEFRRASSHSRQQASRR